MKHLTLYLLLPTLLILAGCAGQGAGRPSASSGALSLEETAVKRWEHLIAGEFGEAWELTTPGYQAVRPREVYAAEMKGRPVRWTGVEYMDKNCPDADRCTVRVEVAFRVKMAVQNVGWVDSSQVLAETWIRTDGRWRYLPEEVGR